MVGGGGYSVFSEVMAAQEIVSFGYGSQSRETMEVEDCYSAKSECYGAFERRRETLTMTDFIEDAKRKKLGHVQLQKRVSGQRLNGGSERRRLLVRKSWGEVRIQMTCG